MSLVARSGGAGDVGVLIAVDGESGDYISTIAGEIGGIGEIVNGVDQGDRTDESVGPAYGAWLGECVTGGRKVGRSGRAGNVDSVARINRDSCQAVGPITAQVGGIQQRGAVQLRRRIDHGNK